jgi:hypothetical protein
MRRSRFCICLTLLFINTVSIAQEKVSPPGDPLLARADRLTDDLVKEAASLNPYPRAILLAGMGETWAAKARAEAIRSRQPTPCFPFLRVTTKRRAMS